MYLLNIVRAATASIRDQSLFINSSNLFLNIVTDGSPSIREQCLYLIYHLYFGILSRMQRLPSVTNPYINSPKCSGWKGFHSRPYQFMYFLNIVTDARASIRDQIQKYRWINNIRIGHGWKPFHP
jgi:hypothetical protein